MIKKWKWALAHFFLAFDLSAQVLTLIESVLVESDYELIEAEFVRARGIWRVFIDREASKRGVDLITVDDCSAMTERLLDAFEANAVEYEYLEVSSPGIDRALTKPNHFVRFAGEVVKLTIEPAFDGLRKLQGALVGLRDGDVEIEVDGAIRQIPLANVSRARVVPQF